MTKLEYEQAMVRTSSYADLKKRLDRIDEILAKWKYFTYFTLEGGSRESISFGGDMKDSMIALLQAERTRVLTELEAL